MKIQQTYQTIPTQTHNTSNSSKRQNSHIKYVSSLSQEKEKLFPTLTLFSPHPSTQRNSPPLKGHTNLNQKPAHRKIRYDPIQKKKEKPLYVSSDNIFTSINEVFPDAKKFSNELKKDTSIKYKMKFTKLIKDLNEEEKRNFSNLINEFSIKKARENQSDIENARLVQSYCKKKIDNDVTNILLYELKKMKDKKIIFDRLQRRYHFDIEKMSKKSKVKSICEQNIDKSRFVELKHPVLEINHEGTASIMFKDGELMSKLFQDGFKHSTEKKYQIKV